MEISKKGYKLIDCVEAWILSPIFDIHNGTRRAVNKLCKVFLCPAFGFSFVFNLPTQSIEIKSAIVLVHFHITLYYFTFRVRA